jgi:putative DNA primase/helicase
MNNLASKINTTLAEVDALPIKPPKVELQYGSTGYDKEHSFVIKGLIPECSFASIYGPSGSYKSFLALDWACHIASGKDWDGHKVNQGSVLYVAGEGGFGVTKRVRAWELQNQVDSIDNLARLPGPVFPADIDQMNIVIEYCDEIETRTGHAVKLIIFDTLARCYGGRDENSSQDMGAFIRGCGSIQQLTGATVLVVHHSGKNVDKGGRGSSSLPAALDVEYLVSRDGEGEQALVLTCSKMKDAEQPDTKAYDLTSVHIRTDSDGDDVNSLCLIPVGRTPNGDDEALSNASHISGNHEVLWQAVRSRTQAGDPTTRAIIIGDLKAQEINVNHFSRWLTKLIEDGHLHLENDTILMGCKGGDKSG